MFLGKNGVSEKKTKKTEAHFPYTFPLIYHPPPSHPFLTLYLKKKLCSHHTNLKKACRTYVRSVQIVKMLPDFLTPSIIILMVRPWVLTKVRNELN